MTHKVPYHNNYNYYQYYNRKRLPFSNTYSQISNHCEQENYKYNNSNKSNSIYTDSSNNSCNDPKKENSNETFEIFGIKLFYDDILIISLILFLYNEGVKDQYLFISLILLLLS